MHDGREYLQFMVQMKGSLCKTARGSWGLDEARKRPILLDLVEVGGSTKPSSLSPILCLPTNMSFANS